MTNLPQFGAAAYPTPVPSTNQVVIPQITFPQPIQASLPPQPVAIQGPDLVSVKGMDGAKAYPTVPNGRYALFDEDDDVMYIKVTDKNNYPVALKRYRFIEEDEPTPAPPPEYVTMEEFNKFKEEMLNAKQSVRSQSYNSGPRNNSEFTGNSSAKQSSGK